MKKIIFIKLCIIIILFYLYNPINKEIFFKFKKKSENLFIHDSNFLLLNKSNINISDFSFKASYFTEYQNQNLQFINKLYEKLIDAIIINNTFKIYNTSNYKLSLPGIHNVLIFINLTHLTTIDYMFYHITNLLSIDFNNINEKKYFQTFKGIFKGCKNLKSVNFNNFSFNNIFDFSHLFSNCKSLSIIYPSINFSEKVTNLSYMFANCSSLKAIYFKDSNAINIRDMSGLFKGCSNLTSVDLSNIRASNIRNIEYIFADCSNLKSINLEFFEFNKIEKVNNAFLNCLSLTSVKFPFLIKKFSDNIEKMFIGCNQLLLTKIQNMFSNSYKLYDVCIVGLWYGCNYGSMLTYFALHQVIKSFNYSILMIDDPLEPDDIIYSKTHPKYMVNALYRVSKKNKLDNLKEFNEECKCFLVGSDQLWNINLSRYLKQFYFLGFVKNETYKLSYGTSFGIKYNGNEEEKIITKGNLRRFNGISVRDKLSLDILKNNFNIKNAIQVCDPTLLCNITEYMKLLSKAKIKYIEKYFLAYVLDPNPEIGKRLEKLAYDMKIKVIIILDHSKSRWETNKKKLSIKENGNVEIKNIVNINEWLWYFNNSYAVFTDSYHGTIFSIIFKKPFITLINIKRGEQRFYSLLQPLKLMYRQFKTSDCINNNYDLFKTIDYIIPYKILSKIKYDSYNWLKNELLFLQQ